VGYEKGETTDQFLERADRILYAEKRSGKALVKEASTVLQFEMQPVNATQAITPPSTIARAR